jgi:hypothetical protein
MDLIFGFGHFYPGKIIQGGRKQQQEQEPPIPTGIKKITRQQQQAILKRQTSFISPPIQDKDYGKKK